MTATFIASTSHNQALEMKQVAITGTREVEIASVPEPTAVDDWAKVRVESAPLCTEYRAWETGRSGTLGHEAAGEVVAVAQPGDVAVGDRVVVMPQHPCGTCELCRTGDYIHCQHNYDFKSYTGQDTGNRTMAQYLLKQDWLLVPIPDGISYDHAAMACCGLGPTFGACDRMNVVGHHTVLITGGGPVGLGGVINATHRGARVIVSEPTPYRQELALELGADDVVNPLEDDVDTVTSLTDGTGVDAVIECSGIPAAQRMAIDVVNRRGQITFVGEGGNVALDVSNDLIRKGIDLHGQWHYNRGLAPDIMSVIGRERAKLETFITHRCSFDGIGEAFSHQADQRTGKVVLHPWD